MDTWILPPPFFVTCVQQQQQAVYTAVRTVLNSSYDNVYFSQRYSSTHTTDTNHLTHAVRTACHRSLRAVHQGSEAIPPCKLHRSLQTIHPRLRSACRVPQRFAYISTMAQSRSYRGGGWSWAKRCYKSVAFFSLDNLLRRLALLLLALDGSHQPPLLSQGPAAEPAPQRHNRPCRWHLAAFRKPSLLSSCSTLCLRCTWYIVYVLLRRHTTAGSSETQFG